MPPTSYAVLGYEFSFDNNPVITTSPDYTYTIPHGRPVGIGAQSDAFVATQDPEQLIAIPPKNVAAAIVQPYLFVPTTIAAYPDPANASSTTDLVLGAVGQAAWLQLYSFVTNTSVSANTAPLDGTTVALSPSPFFGQSEHDVAIAVSGAPDRLEYVLLGNNPPTVPGNVDLTPYGAPIGVSTGSQSAWLVTDVQLAEFGVPALGMIRKALLPSNTGTPVSIAGGDFVDSITTATDFIVVAFQPTTGGQAQILGFHGGNPQDTAKTSHVFTGNPVQLRATQADGVEYAWVATANPDQILLFVVSTNGSAPIATLPLPGHPIDFVVGAPPFATPAPSDAGTRGTRTGLINVIVSQ